ncbi:unnamed protein product [Adineta steineri]|uniref:Uncharacterized protein n=1 Tax=Adineta steineri TaxID=433720 RepID=A0A815MG41_9BILA|nr:unnamed protein product [Adineta steineri]CAF1621868.1 unnamed protein product [Adineta steineri]
MATATAAGKARCVTCGKEKSTVRCDGCSQPFCMNHFGHHRQELDKQLGEIEVSRDLFRQTLTEQSAKPENQTLIIQINQWEQDSIAKVRQTANEARQTILQHTTKYLTEIEIKLNTLTKELRESREENDFIEADLQRWKTQLTEMTNELDKPSTITIQHSSIPLITTIRINVSVSSHLPNLGIDAKWIQNGITVAGGNGQGNATNQLCNPYSMYIDEDETIYIADFNNHRIVEWKRGASNGQIVAGGNGSGNQNNQLNNPTSVIADKVNDCFIISDYGNKRVIRWPRQNGTNGQTIISNINCLGLTMDNEGHLYVCDNDKHEVRRWKVGDKNGIVVAGGNGQGNRLDQLNTPWSIFVDEENSLYISDFGNHRVVKWMKDAKEGIVVAVDQGLGNGLTQLLSSRGVTVDQIGNVYVADQGNCRVMRWSKHAIEGSIIVGDIKLGAGANQLNNPLDLSFDQQGNLYVVDHGNHRVQKFNIDSSRK